MIASYRWSQLTGNFEGFFRNDNGQSDPAISSLFDFPTNDPTYTAIGVPQFGYGGDVRFLGCTLGCESLPNDRTHQFKLYANRSWSSLNLGMGFNAGTGRPLTLFTSNPNYTSGGEIPRAPRGSGFNTVDGFFDESPFETAFDLHVDYTVKFGGQRLVLIADAFNLFNRRADGLRQLGRDGLRRGQPGLGAALDRRLVVHVVPEPAQHPAGRAVRVVVG